MHLAEIVTPPADLHVPPELEAELSRLSTLVDDIDSQRPLSGGNLDAIARELRFDAVHQSAAIEGLALSQRETVHVLTTGAILDGHRRESQEVLNLQAACELACTLIEGQHRLSASAVRQLHAELMRGLTEDEELGRYRPGDVTIAGALVQPPPGPSVAPLMAEFETTYGEALSLPLHPLVLASWAHHAIARIHPFVDGNGRVARCVQDMVLLQHHFVSATIRHADRPAYYEALARADEGDYEPLVRLNLTRAEAVADRYLAAVRLQEERTAWARRIVTAAQEQEVERRRAAYDQWRRAMERIRFEFELECGELERQSGRPLVQVQRYDMLEFEQWATLLETGRVAGTWLFRLHFQRTRPPNLVYVFFFGRHQWRDEDPPRVRNNQLVSLLVSERPPFDSSAGEKPPYRILDESEERVSLREVLVVGGTTIRRRYDPAAGENVYDEDISPLTIATQFLEEVLRNRLGLI